jgi:hypothetical protein
MNFSINIYILKIFYPILQIFAFCSVRFFFIAKATIECFDIIFDNLKFCILFKKWKDQWCNSSMG